MTRPASEMRGRSAVANTADRPWSLFGHALLYQAGLPFERFTRLACRATVTALDSAFSAETDLARAADGVFAALRSGGDHVDRTVARKIRKLLTAGRAIPDSLSAEPALNEAADRWNAGLRHRSESLAQAAAQFAAELSATRAELREVAGDPVFREALATTNPGFAPRALDRYIRTWSPARRDSRTRYTELKIVAYLQRLTSKTHVSSLLGMVNPVEVARTVTGFNVRVSPGGAPAQRATFMGYWAVDALARTIGRDPGVRMYLPPAVSPLIRLTPDGAVIGLLDAAVPLTAQERSFIEMSDGRRRVEEIAAALGIPSQTALARTEKLARRGVIAFGLRVPVTVFQPLNALAALVRELPDGCVRRDYWLGVLARFDRLRDDFSRGDTGQRLLALASAEELFGQVTGRSARRNAGRTYGDRLLFYEECRGPVESCVIGGDLARSVEDRLRVPLDVCAAYGSLFARHYQSIARQAYRSVAQGDGQPVPFTEVAQAMAAIPEPEPEYALRAFETRWRQLIAERTDANVARLSAADLTALCADVPDPRPAAHAAVDLFVSATGPADIASGQALWVMGEVGENVMPWGSQIYFHPDRSRVLKETEEAFTAIGYPPLAIIVPERRHKGMLNDGFPGLFVLARAPVGRTVRTLALKDLFVRGDGRRVWLATPDGTELRFFHHHDDKAHLWAFAAPRILLPPLSATPQRPRVCLGDVVLLRAEWDVTASDWLIRDDDFTQFRRARQCQRERGIPDLVFARFPGVLKPYCVNLASALSVQFFASVLRTHGRVVLTEMLPGPEKLWLQDQGRGYCTELRTLLLRRGPDYELRRGAIDQPSPGRNRGPGRLRARGGTVACPRER